MVTLAAAEAEKGEAHRTDCFRSRYVIIYDNIFRGDWSRCLNPVTAEISLFIFIS